jgi:hypothetical protein
MQCTAVPREHVQVHVQPEMSFLCTNWQLLSCPNRRPPPQVHLPTTYLGTKGDLHGICQLLYACQQTSTTLITEADLLGCEASCLQEVEGLRSSEDHERQLGHIIGCSTLVEAYVMMHMCDVKGEDGGRGPVCCTMDGTDAWNGFPSLTCCLPRRAT